MNILCSSIRNISVSIFILKSIFNNIWRGHPPHIFCKFEKPLNLSRMIGRWNIQFMAICRLQPSFFDFWLWENLKEKNWVFWILRKSWQNIFQKNLQKKYLIKIFFLPVKSSVCLSISCREIAKRILLM